MLDTLQSVCVCVYLYKIPPRSPVFLPLSLFVCEQTVSEGACGAGLMCTAGSAVSAENGHTPLPNDATSILQRRAGRCVCVHKAPILGATAQHTAQLLITLYLARSMCVSICVCECESEGSCAPINIKYRYPCQ